MNSVQKCQTHIRNLAVWTPQDFQCMLSHNIQNGKKIKQYKHMKSSKKPWFSLEIIYDDIRNFFKKLGGCFADVLWKKVFLKISQISTPFLT